MIYGDGSEYCGKVLDDRYRILRRIGLGGTGMVFEGSCLDRGDTVAIKMLRQSFCGHADLCSRLRREAEAARDIRHPGIIPVIDEGTLSNGSPYLVMRRMYGESLSRLLLRRGRLPVHQVAALAVRVASILQSVHHAGYTHRDVKPEHILLNRSALGDLLVHLLDFGVCSSATMPVAEQQRELGKVFGTPTYVSPEQASGNPRVDGRADLFSLGIVMFESLTGRLPFNDRPVSRLLLRIIHHDAPRLSAVTPGMEPRMSAIVAGLLARDPERRIANGRSLARALVPLTVRRDAEEQPREAERQIAALVKTSNRMTHTVPGVRRMPPARAEAA